MDVHMLTTAVFVHVQMGAASIPYLLGSEIPNSALREKTQALGAAWNVVWAFVTSFIIPYMIDAMHFKVGWVFGSIAVIALVFTFFFLPETKVSLSCLVDPTVLRLTWHVFNRVAPLRKLTPYSVLATALFGLSRLIIQMLSSVLAYLKRRKGRYFFLPNQMTKTLAMLKTIGVEPLEMIT